MTPPKDLIDTLRREDDFLIAAHMNPDGDAIGSALALAAALEAVGKRVSIVDRDPIPQHYRFLPNVEKFHTLSDLSGTGISLERCTNLILVDCNDITRVVADKAVAGRFSCRNAIVIDHHATPSSFGTVRWIVPDAAATALLILEIIDALSIMLTADMATLLYAALIVDTGNFRFENTDAKVLRVAARLTEAGADPASISRALFEAWTSARFALFSRFLDTVELSERIVTSVVTNRMLQETGATSDQTETFVEFLKRMQDADVAVLITELEKDHYKLSMRAKGTVNVAKVAEAFGGGGHANAAGCRIRAGLDEVKRMVRARIAESMRVK